MARKLKILCILDPLEKLNAPIDTSLQLLKRLNERGHTIETCDVQDVFFKNKTVYALAKRLTPRRADRFSESKAKVRAAGSFDLILNRKEPPFDINFVYLTYLLELVSKDVPVANDPRGVRNLNEKMSSLYFAADMPRTCVSRSVDQILAFRRELAGDMIVKPLDQKGGVNILLVKKRDQNAGTHIHRATGGGRMFVMAQQYLPPKKIRGEKRVFFLNGKILCTCEKRPLGKEFRANLGLGGTYHAARLTTAEEKFLKPIGALLKTENILHAGLDIMQGKLLEINVTCTGGMVETEAVYPKLKPLTVLAEALEALPGLPARAPQARKPKRS